MEDQSTYTNSPTIPVAEDVSDSKGEPKPTFLGIVLAIFLSALVFGPLGFFVGYQIGIDSESKDNNLTNISISPTVVESNETTSTPTPTITKIPARNLVYKLPEGWTAARDTGNRLEVGYDSKRYKTITSNGRVDLSGLWTGTQGVDLKRLGWNRYFYIISYDGSSRHSALYKILGITSSTTDWKSPEYYSEREYVYNSWNCLLINGVNISQYPVAWGYCPITSSEALVLAFDGYDWNEIEEQMAAIRILK